MLTFHGSLPCSHAFISPCRAVLGPSNLRIFYLPLNSEFATGCVIWKLFTFVSFCPLRCRTTFLTGYLVARMSIIILPTRFEVYGSLVYIGAEVSACMIIMLYVV